MRYCDNCNNEIRDDARFCSKCGKYIGLKFCPKCGNMLNESANFCPRCGQRQPALIPITNNVTPQAKVFTRPRKYKKKVIPLMVWSLFLVALINVFSTPLGAASTLYLLSANTDSDEQSSDLKIKKSLILCITATAIDVLTFLVLLIMVINNFRR